MQDKPLSQESIFKIIWTVIFGVALAFGGSALEPFPIPGANVTAATPFVALMVTLNKLVLRRPFSVTAMYAVTGMVAIFTTYLGPPSPLKPLFILAGLSFDLATGLRTKNLRYWNILLGHLAITITGFFIFWVIFAIMVPGSASGIAKLLMVAAPVHFLFSIVIAYIVYRIIPPDNPPDIVAIIRSQVGSGDQDETSLLIDETGEIIALPEQTSKEKEPHK